MPTRELKDQSSSESTPGSPSVPDDIFQVPSGKTWLINKLVAERTGSSGTVGTVYLQKTSSADAVKVKFDLGTGGTAVGAGSEIPEVRGMVLSNQEKLRVENDGGSAGNNISTNWDISYLEITP